MDDFVQWAIEMVQSVDPVLRTVLAGIAVMLETSVLIGLIVPGDTVVLVASIGVASWTEGIILGVTVIVGALIGESIGFWLGHWVGPHIRTSWLGRRIGEDHWMRAERYVLRRGGVAIFLSRFLPVLHSLVPLTVGMSGYAYRRFIAWTLPACVLWTAIYVGVAATAAGNYDELSARVHNAGYIFVAIIVALLLAVVIGKKVLHRIEARHMAHDADAASAEERPHTEP
ncbi:DedA family protein [Microbacterium esteraromaticum]|uniref:DedA family protein n=1 Tax=Microbacterium esteraromaticum TaxID=57043 RepID=A0A939DYH2_9MICO|nr:DedA family protein [Microbacterium esteraromaticum]MBN7792297.1 DedA family protein [Microbacterium esteraromaticum]MBN8206368.1 DedA family protein [Microbacterium esteraromaticum]MBN8416523.1 DedA family protein [Microbacterium esteraromaticum]MBN8423081.1 DedA family protein [Microbacterium esteraromaticum]MCA1306540.1 DedA family protein [Microbacterium esteraromaticum]